MSTRPPGRPGEAEAVAASAVDLWVKVRMDDGCTSIAPKTSDEIAAEVVALAYPVIARAVAEDIAVEMERARDSGDHHELCSLTQAAHIARYSGGLLTRAERPSPRLVAAPDTFLGKAEERP